MTKLRLAFMGTPDFAVKALRALVDAGHDIVAVYCQPPKPAGRGQHIKKSPVQVAAEELGLTIHTPKTLRDAAEQHTFASLKLDAAIVAAYGLLLPKEILAAPRFGCLNIHASLLPRWRGAAPIQRSLLANDKETGITIMQMDTGLDTGAMLRQSSCPITNTTTAGSLHDTLMELGAQLIVPTLTDWTSGKIKPIPQPSEGVTYAAKCTRDDGCIDWLNPAKDIERQIRALQPWPGCFFMLKQEPIKVLASELSHKSGIPGTLLDDQLTVACGEQSLILTKIQRPGKSAIDGAAFLRGQRLILGQPL